MAPVALLRATSCALLFFITGSCAGAPRQDIKTILMGEAGLAVVVDERLAVQPQVPLLAFVATLGRVLCSWVALPSVYNRPCLGAAIEHIQTSLASDKRACGTTNRTRTDGAVGLMPPLRCG